MSAFASVLRQIQNDLFDAGADLSTPVVENPEHPPLRITPGLHRPAGVAGATSSTSRCRR